MDVKRQAVWTGHSHKKQIAAKANRQDQGKPREGSEAARKQIAVAAREDGKQNRGTDSEEGVEQGVCNVKKCGLAECRNIGAIHNQEEATNEQPFGNAGKAQRIIFHRFELICPEF